MLSFSKNLRVMCFFEYRGDCTRKPSVRQRKATLVAKPYHPELAAAYASLMGPASARAGLKGGV